MQGIEYSNQAKNFLSRLDKHLLIRVFERIEKLKESPVPSDAKFICRDNNEKIFRYRVGDYRVLYKIKEKDKIILITKIDKRSKVYN